MIEKVGKHLRQAIRDGFSDERNLKWPPSPSDLSQLDNAIPDVLQQLLCYVLTGKKIPSTSQSQRLIKSICQYIYRAATNESWKMPKHILLCMALRHLYRSEKLVTLLNRLGHSESYSFALEPETALAEATIQSSSQLSNKIIRSPSGPSLFHSEFDNFNSLINSLTGKGSIHTAHGIMLQEVEDDSAGICPKMPSQPRSKQRSLRLT